ncbi:nudix (nucleoside diphosphate linked moiety X)-type motif 2 [Actinomortierella ambigua]|nr:nudix (nucleoside diphosphate linked moiety X)-type motif 2 [Actinomortierella ambigua]
MDKSLHVAGILIYRHQRNSTEILLVNDSFNHKRHWTAPKGRVIGDEDELKAAIRETLEITGLSVKDLKIEDGFRAELKYLSGNKPKRVVYHLAELIDHARVLPTGEGVQFSWCNSQQANDKALYKSMQDVLRAAFATAEKNRAKHLASLPSKHRHHTASAAADHSNNDILESNMKNLNIALPLDSQRQAISRGYNGGLGDSRDQRQGNQRERGNGHNPHADNPNYKTRLCERFEAEGSCPYFNKCTFAHGSAELRQRPAPAEGHERSSALSASHQQRQRREDAPQAHERVENEFHKTRLCEKFMNEGECPFGNRCTYAHGREELRARGGGLLTKEQQRDQERGFGRRQYSNSNTNGGRTSSYGEEADRQDRWRSDRDQRSSPFRNSQGDQQREQQPPHQHQYQQPQQPQERYRPPPPDTNSPTGAYRAPHLRGLNASSSPQATSNLSSAASEDARPSASTASPTASNPVAPIAAATAVAASTPVASMMTRVASPAAQALTPASAASATAGDVTPTSGSNSPSLGGSATFDNRSNNNNNGNSSAGRRRAQGDHLLEKPRAKVVELSSEEMEKFQIRRPETPPAPAKPDSKQLRDQLIADLTKFFEKQRQAEKEAGELTAALKKQQYQEEVKEVTRIEMKNGLTMAQLYYILISALFTEASIETWKKVLADKTKLLKNFCRSSEDQKTLMRAWEQFFVQRRPMMARIMIILESVYDSELVEEDVIVSWYNHPTTDDELKKKSTPFIEWLSSAEEE